MTDSSVSLTQSAAVEFLKEGIKVRVNAIAPGYMRTAIIPEVLEEYTKRTDYWGDPICKCCCAFPSHLLTNSTTYKAIANAALFLASGESLGRCFPSATTYPHLKMNPISSMARLL